MENKNTIPEKGSYNITKHTPSIVPSLNLAHVYFLFRANGDEVRFEIREGRIESERYRLNASEIYYIKQNIEKL